MLLFIHLFALGISALVLGGGWVFRSVITSSLPTAPQRQDHRTTVVPRSWDILGIVKISNVFYAAAKGTIIQYLETSWNLYGDTHTINVLGTKVIFTRNAANIKSIFKNQFDDYDAAKGSRDRVFKHLFPNSIVTTDGHEWRKERGEILPHLSYIGQGLKTETMESSFQLLVQRIAEANAIDLQLLVFGFGTDILHEFAVGETLHCMDPQNQSSGERAYADALIRVSSTIVQRLMLGPVAWLLPHKTFKPDCNTIRGYFSHVVSKKLSARQGQGDSNDGKKELPLGETLFNRLLGSDQDPIKLGHNLAMFMMASEPLTAFLSHVIWLLSRNPTVYKDLRKEVLNTVGYRKPTPEQLPKFVFLEKVMNESLRVLPTEPIALRIANTDTLLPTGGGADGMDSLLVRKGQRVVVSIFGTHRSPAYFGKDASEFRPERWDSISTSTPGYVPFSIGPRACIGQRILRRVSSYTLVRLVQTYSHIADRNNIDFAPGVKLALFNMDGVRISFTLDPQAAKGHA